MTAGSEKGPAVPGRRDRSAAGRRPHGVLIKLTDEERDLLAMRAKAQGISVPRYLLECANAVEGSGGVMETKTQRDEFVKDLMSVRRLLANVANNVNQVARVANSSGLAGTKEQANASFAAARRASDRLYDLADKLLGLHGPKEK